MIDADQSGALARYRILQSVVYGMVLLFAGRLAYLQIIKGNVYKLKSEAQAIKQITVDPFRGCMFDRDGKILVSNSVSVSLTITPHEFRKETIPLLSAITQIPEFELQHLLDSNSKKSRITPFKIARDIDFKMVADVEENSENLPGVATEMESKRTYDFYGNGGHLFGYLREVNDKRIQELGSYYKPGDVAGAIGLERSYERSLCGQKGVAFVAVTAGGKRVSSFNDGKGDIRALEGDDLYTGIDIKLQEYAELLLRRTAKSGAVVAIDPSNGEILCLTSQPDFDVRKFSGKTSRDYFNEVWNDPDKPLFNRATMTAYPPGSTIKMMVALAGLQEGLITPSTTLPCVGGYLFGGRFFKCHGGVHGAINVHRAIQVSCNSFFYQLAIKLGIDRFHKYGSMFHFGMKSSDAPELEESKGLLPNDAYYKKRLKSGYQGRVINLGIGQGELGVSPLQMASYMSTIANGGVYHQPHVVRSVFNKYAKKKFKTEVHSEKVKIDPSYFKIVQDALRDVVNAGTARNASVLGVQVCGKTGTAQNSRGRDHSWFVCYAPYDNPRIALCVLVENAGFGAEVAVPIAQQLLNAYFYPVNYPNLDPRSRSRSGLPTDSTATDSLQPIEGLPTDDEIQPESPSSPGL